MSDQMKPITPTSNPGPWSPPAASVTPAEQAIASAAPGLIADTLAKTGGALVSTGKTAIELVVAQQLLLIGREGVEIGAGRIAGSRLLGGTWIVKKLSAWKARRDARKLVGGLFYRLGELALTAFVEGNAEKIPYLGASAKGKVKRLARAALVIQSGQIASEMLTPKVTKLLQMFRQMNEAQIGEGTPGEKDETKS